MNEQLQNALADILEKASNGVDAGVGLLQQELPDVIGQLLVWYGFVNAFYFLFALALFFVFVKIDVAIYKKAKDEKWSEEEMIMGYYCIGSFARLVHIIPICMINLEWMQIWIAPKIWLIEYSAQLVK